MHSWAPLPDDIKRRFRFKICNIINRLQEIPGRRKYSLTFYTRVHHGNLDPILASEKRAERDWCLAYGGILGVSKDGAFYGNS